MISARKLAITGVTSLAVAIGTLTLPFSQSAGAVAVEDVKQPQKVLSLENGSNEAVDVNTELDCSIHALTAKVKNKTKTTLDPDVTFNDKASTIKDYPIEPGQTGIYYYHYTGNKLPVETKVGVDTFEPIVIPQTLNCSEPVSFNMTESSHSAVIGTLSNNSSLVSQTAYTQVGSGDVRVEQLQPGESRTIAMPFQGSIGQENTMVRIATSFGYESSYWVSLDKANPPQLTSALSVNN